MKKSATIEEVRNALDGVDIFAIRSVEGAPQVVCTRSAQIAQKITELLDAHDLLVGNFQLMHPDGKTTLHLNDDGSVTQESFDKAGNIDTTFIHPAPSLDGLTKVDVPTRLD